MNAPCLIRAAVVGASLAAPAVTLAQVSLQIVVTGPNTSVTLSDISGDGQTVTGSTRYAAGTVPSGEEQRTWRWRPATGFTYIGYSTTSVNGDKPVLTTQHGDQCVYTFGSLIGGRPVRWTGPGATAVLPQREAGRSCFANGLSADGHVIVGWSYYVSPENNTTSIPCYWLDNGFGGTLGTLPGGFYGQATDVNADGSVIVGWGSSATNEQAWRWTPQDGMQGLGFLVPGFYSHALAVSTDGSTIVGVAGSSSGDRPVKWAGAGSTQALPVVSGIPYTQYGAALSVNGDGSLIGGSVRTSIMGNSHAAVWHPTSGLIDLMTWLPEHGVDLQGVNLLAVTGISDDGHTLVGPSNGGSPGVDGRGFFVLHVTFGPQCGIADVGSQGASIGNDGVLDNNDFIVFINRFFARDPRADIGTPGGFAGSDLSFDNNDFIAFINAFFAGC